MLEDKINSKKKNQNCLVNFLIDMNFLYNFFQELQQFQIFTQIYERLMIYSRHAVLSTGSMFTHGLRVRYKWQILGISGMGIHTIVL